MSVLWLIGACGEGAEPAGDDSSTSSGSTATQTTTASSGAPTTTSAETSGPSSTTGADTSADSEGSDGSSTGDVLPEDQVPVFVSIAHGGQTAMTCDRGRTWIGFNDFGPQDDHNDYAAFGGITYGDGAFVAATGWGTPARILRSSDGITWEDLPDSAFTNQFGESARPGGGASGVEYTGEKFLLFSGGLWESDDGLTWQENTPDTLQAWDAHYREVEYLAEPDLLLIAIDWYFGPNEGTWQIHASADGGATWYWGDGITPACVGAIQHAGGFAHHDGRLMIAGGDGPTCISDDGGMTWTPGGDAGFFISDLKSSDAGFLILGEGTLKHSTDGMSWTTVASSVDAGRIDWHAALGYVGAGSGYIYGDEFSSWTAADAALPSGFGGVKEFAFGLIEPTADCPLPSQRH